MEPSNPTPESNMTPTPLPKRQHRAIWLTIVLFVLLVAGMFAFTVMKQQEIKEEVTPVSTTTEEPDTYAGITRIDGKHFYIDGEHTVVGEIPMPTPCDLLEVDAIVAESFPEQITLDFSVINNSPDCEDIVTSQRFKVSATASPEATFTALFQNRVVELNLTPAGPDETPDDFELFIKG